jgi:hypothetical protein
MQYERQIIIGQRDGWNESKPFGISTSDHRFHVYILGKTGSGKTTLLRNLLIQHIAHGHGVGLIDPHGDLAVDLLNQIPPWRTDDLVYFNPSDVDFPISMNLVANSTRDDRHLIASGIVGACKNIWHDSWGPRLEYIFYNSVAAILDCQNTSLLGVNRMLTDDKYRAWIIRQIKDPFIHNFWKEEFSGYDLRFQREIISPIQNKLGQFLLNPVIRNILGQVKCKVSIPFTMDNGRLFLANLSKGRLGYDKANLLGSLLVTQFQLAAMARSKVQEDERKDFFLFIDEFQSFTTEAFTTILSEARKYRLCLVLANQFIDQLSQSVQQSVLGNVGTLICFQIGHTDAKIMEGAFGNEFLAQQFIDLDRHEVLVRLMENGRNHVPFRGKTLPPIEYQVGQIDKLVARSRERFTESRNKVEEKLNRWISNR